MTTASKQDPVTADVESRLRRFPARGMPPSLSGGDVSYAVEETPIGRVLLATSDTGVLLASAFAADDTAVDALLERLGRVVSPRVVHAPGAVDEARRQLADYLSGRRRSFDLRTDFVLTGAFQATVLRTLADRVGYGERTSYGQLARWVDRPAAARAVGGALGTNPLCVVFPCHRVVGSGGALTGYAGGLPAKTYLLDLEARTT